MGLEGGGDVRNLAVVAHVDHGKTTLVDAMLWQAEVLREGGPGADRLAELLGPPREKSLNAMPRTVAVPYGGARINLVDMPGHAAFGGEVERTVRMVDGFLFLVDACEGPLPQSRFVLRKALEAGLAPIVVVTKIDRGDARPREVLGEVYDLFIDLDASENQLDFPVLYCDARRGLVRRAPESADESLIPLFEEVLRSVPPPGGDPGGTLQMLVTHLDYDDVLGRFAVGRVVAGRLVRGARVAHCRPDGTVAEAEVSGLFVLDGVRRVEAVQAGPGEIVAVTGIASLTVGDTVSDPSKPVALPPVQLDEPTIAIEVSVNDSPMAGLEGQFVTARRLRERLWREILSNPSIRVEETETPDAFRVAGRAELQLAILLEMMRREGYELAVGKPRILTRGSGAETEEPMEILVLDCPERFSAAIPQKLKDRKGRMTKMVNHGAGRVRMEFRIPSRGLLGFRTEFLADTRGTGIMNHVFDGYAAWQGEIPQRLTGALVADRPGRCTTHAVEHLQDRGAMFVGPGDAVYEGMIVGENSRPADVDLDVTKERKISNSSFSPAVESVRLIPPRSMTLEQALEFLRDDELVEVTPKALRLRKRVLQAVRRRAVASR